MNALARRIPAILNLVATILLCAAVYEALRFNAWSAVCDLFLSHMLITESKLIVIKRRIVDATSNSYIT